MARIGVFVNLQNWMGRPVSDPHVNLFLINIHPVLTYVESGMVSFNEMWIRYARGYKTRYARGYKTSSWSFGLVAGATKLYGYELYERNVLVGKVEISCISGGYSVLIEATGFRFNYDVDVTGHFVSCFKTRIAALVDNPDEISVEVFRGPKKMIKTLRNDRITFDRSWADIETALEIFLQIRKILLDAGF